MLIRKLFKAETAHSVPGAYTCRCQYLHGHSYQFEIFLRSAKPNPTHMVIDFKAMKEIGINDLIDSFDHSVVLWSKDPLARKVSTINPRRHIVVPFIPTAEMLAKALFVLSQEILDTAPNLSGEKDVLVERVEVQETATGKGIFTRADLKDDQFPPIQFAKWKISKGIQDEWVNKKWFKKIR